jgi:DNA-binding transcriptional ArsR family regulator
MQDSPNITTIAALIGDHARAEVLTALMSGMALTATELADIAGVTRQTISCHLAKLVDVRLLSLEAQGRHRYFRIASTEVAQLLESLMAGPSAPAPCACARVRVRRHCARRGSAMTTWPANLAC